MISPVYTEQYTKQTSHSTTYPNKIDYLEYKRKKLRRQAFIKKQQQLALRRLFFLAVIFILAITGIYKISYRHIYLPLKNSKLNLVVDKNFLNSSTAILATTDVLGDRNLFNNSNVSYFSPIMKPMPLNKELIHLKNQLLPILNSDPQYKAGLFIWDSKTHNFVSIRSDQAFATASIIKIPVLIELYRQIDQGLIDFDSNYRFKKLHLASGSGGLQYKPLNTSHSLNHLARIMIQHSDNTATNILLHAIGGADSLNRAMAAWGINNGHMENWLPDLSGTNYMSPKDYALMLYNVSYNPEFLSSFSKNKILDYMSNIRNRNLINCGMPCGSTIAHKTGDIGSMVGDAGIITLPNGRQIIMIAMVERPWNSYKAKDIIREASKITYNYFEN